MDKFISIATESGVSYRAKEAAQVAVRIEFPCAAAAQNGASSFVALDRLLCSRALIRDFAVAVLWRNR